MADYYLRCTCRMCSSTQLNMVLSLSPTPPGNRFLRPEEIGQPEAVYPLDLNLCRDCGHVQLRHVVDARVLYQNSYGYVSGTSSKFVNHLRDYAAEVVARFKLLPGSLVADIGSNDGTCLRFFAEAGMRVLGIDPATHIAERATASGIPTLSDFFSRELGVRLRAEYGAAKFITSHNTCAHIDDLEGVLHGVRNWLADDGVFGCEVGYFLDVHQNTWFDTIYHEHLDYHTVGPFAHLLSRVGMEAFAVRRVSTQGGSIRLYAQKAGGPHASDGTVDELIALERNRRLDVPETFEKFGDQIAAVGADLRELIKRLKAQGKSVAGYGAPTKSTTLLTHFSLGRDEIDFIVDDNPLKHGRFSPLSHIPVYGVPELYQRRPDYLLILAWNFAEPIMAAHRAYVERGGKFIVPMPVARVVG